MSLYRAFYPQLENEGRINAYEYATSKVVCVGRNYADHARELNNPTPSQPVFFAKSSDSLSQLEETLAIPLSLGQCHYELELALLIGEPLKGKQDFIWQRDIAGVGLALDLTRREVQSELKAKGHPWERAKNFVGACPVTRFIPLASLQEANPNRMQFCLRKNGKVVQQGDSGDMLFPVAELIADLNGWLPLYPGDILLTGTPAGVGPLEAGDRLELCLMEQSLATVTVTRQ